jgi:hypothetical protein
VIRVGRRLFVGLGLSALGGSLLASDAGLIFPLPETADLTLFDPRFPHARALVLQIARGGRVLPIAGDPTDTALWFQSRAATRARTCIQGVTPESVPFCLRQIVPHAPLSIRRIDRDLFAWAVRLPG